MRLLKMLLDLKLLVQTIRTDPAMSRHFYEDEPIAVQSSKGPLVPSILTASSDVTTKTLPTGNQIAESLPVTKWVHDIRSSIISKYRLYEAEISTQQSAAINEWTAAKEYVLENVVNDKYEREEILVPASTLALSAFFSGRVLSNTKNWGFSSPFNNDASYLVRKPTILGRLFVSVPSKVLLPWFLAGAVFSQLVPRTWENTVSCVERDLLPKKFVSDYHGLWKSLYVHGLKQNAEDFGKQVDAVLQANIKDLRMRIAKMLN